MNDKLVRAIDAATELGVPAPELYALIDEGVVEGHRRDDRLWVDLAEVRNAFTDRVDLPSAPS